MTRLQAILRSLAASAFAAAAAFFPAAASRAAEPAYGSPSGGGTAGGKSGAKYALCVGINRYARASSLQGCANDAMYFRAGLVGTGGWAAEDAVLLADGDATKAAVRAAIADVAAKAAPGDTFVYVQSSHGGQFSGTSVYLCMHDANYSDAELAEDLGAFRSGVKVAVIVDACHSGGLFKAAGGGGSGSFDIAGRVTALIDENRAGRLKRGDKAASDRISSAEIGWVTAAEYNQYSLDGGFYDTDAWLRDPDAEGEVRGGVFLGAFAWNWWNGTADSGAAGDGDGLADPVECWRAARDFCTKLDSFWGVSGYAFTPQMLHESVLRGVELGLSGGGVPEPVPPANDGFAAAFVLSGTSGSAAGTNLGATLESGEPAPSAAPEARASVWWRWTAPVDGPIRFSTAGSSFDTVLSVWEGGSFAALSEVASDDDGGGNQTSFCQFDAVAGTDYRVAVCGYGASAGIVKLSWKSAAGLSSELQEAVEQPGLVFSTGGDADWSGVEDESWDGEDSARSGKIGNGGETWMQASGAAGEGVVSFRWKVSSEADWDFAEFLVDGEIKMWRSGTGGGWRREAFRVGEGEHSFRWVYWKDGSVSRGSDCVWVDSVEWSPGSPLAPVYRFWSSGYRGHFFTADWLEAATVLAENPNWSYEGVAFFALPERSADSSPVHRFWSKRYRAHFFTIDEAEMKKVRDTDPNWKYEGVAYWALRGSGGGAVPVYRFWSKGYRHHFYTADEDEKAALVATNPNWKYEGIAFYAWNGPDCGWTLSAADGTRIGRDSVAVLGGALLETRGDAPDAGELLSHAEYAEFVSHAEYAEFVSHAEYAEFVSHAEFAEFVSHAEFAEYAEFSMSANAGFAGRAPSRPESAEGDLHGGASPPGEPLSLRLSLPPGEWNATLWSAADGMLADEPAEDFFEFPLPASDVWHWLRVRDGDEEDGDPDAFSLWLRAE